MTVLTGLAYLAAIGAASGLLNWLEWYSVKRFRHRFMTRPAFLLVACAVVCAVFGLEWWKEASATQGDELNGILLMASGAIAIGGRLVWNIRKTNLVLGTIGTGVQTGIFGALAFIGFFVLCIYLFAQALLLTSAKPVYNINR